MTESGWETAAWAASTVALAALLALALTCWLALHRPELTARFAGPAATARRTEAAARLGEQDDLVQTLVIATYALELGDHDRARDAVDGALRRSRSTLDQLLTEAGRSALTTAAEQTADARQPTDAQPTGTGDHAAHDSTAHDSTAHDSTRHDSTAHDSTRHAA